MNNAALTAIIAEYGEAMCYLILDNNRRIALDYDSASSAKLTELEFEVHGGVDFIKVKRRHSKDGGEYIFHNLITTDSVRGVIIMGEGFEQYRVDPYIIA